MPNTIGNRISHIIVYTLYLILKGAIDTDTDVLDHMGHYVGIAVGVYLVDLGEEGGEGGLGRD